MAMGRAKLTKKDLVAQKPELKGLGQRAARIAFYAKEIRQMSMQGMNQQQIAAALGLHYNTITAWKDNPEFVKLMTEGLAEGVKVASTGLMHLVKRRNGRAIEFFLKTKGQFKTSDEVTVKGDANSPLVHVYLPDNKRGGK